MENPEIPESATYHWSADLETEFSKRQIEVLLFDFKNSLKRKSNIKHFEEYSMYKLSLLENFLKDSDYSQVLLKKLV